VSTPAETPARRPSRRGSVAASAGLVLALGTLAGCATGPASGPGQFDDPYETQNRQWHSFNTGVDKVVYRPVSMAYGTVVPQPIRTGVLHFAETLDIPRRMVNTALQGDLDGTVHNFFRFLVNATVGVFGIFDPATHMGLGEYDTDFGATLHAWGVGEGAYMSVPFLGPSTQRDFAGEVVDFFTNPLSWVVPSPEKYTDDVADLAEKADYRYTYRNTIDDVLHNSADSYAQTRLIYLDARRYELQQEDARRHHQGNPDASGDVDPYADAGSAQASGSVVDPYADAGGAATAPAAPAKTSAMIDPYEDLNGN